MDSNGIRCLRMGDGPGVPPVLLLHGFTGSAEAWGASILEGLSRRGPLLAVDLPGHGRSPAAADPDRYALERVVEDLLRLLDRSGVERADWVGYSMGGRIALGAAILHPGRVRRLVLEAASPGLAEAEDRRRRRREDEAIARRLEEEGIEAFIDFWTSRPLFASQRTLPPPVLERMRGVRLQNRPAELAAVLRGLGTGSQPSFWDRLHEVETSTLLLTGALDPKFVALARAMAERLPGATHRIVADAGHAVHLEAPEGWLTEVVPFLAGEEAGR